jgi:SAM-dependent MidA family methyltransferase
MTRGKSANNSTLLMPETFTSFMARALHDPQRGYYARRVQAIGAKGDFSTSATLSPQLGQAIAQWLKGESKVMPEVRHIIEVGAGNGMLMETVQKSMGWWQRRRFQWHIVETSEGLCAQQKQRLGKRVTWHRDLGSALDSVGGKAFIYHNELLDAFPVVLLQWQEDQWQEVCVDLGGNQVRESLMPHSLTAADCESFAIFQRPPQTASQRVELHLSVRDWLRQWAPAWTEGAMLTVDYGDVFPELYHRRPRGTLRAYLLHQRLEGAALYQNMGRQDITADVNFTDYRAWAKGLGWEETYFGTQGEFTELRLGAGAPLLLAEGAADAFKVVCHRRLRR